MPVAPASWPAVTSRKLPRGVEPDYASIAGAGRSVISGRELRRDQIQQVWQIDRREVIERIYYLQNGELVLKPEHYDMAGWPEGESALYAPLLLDCFDRGGWFYGLFEEAGLIGVAVLESKFIGRERDLLQLKFMHVSAAYRQQGLGRRLFEMARARAAEKGAKGLYISATPSENTVNFYLRLGCVVSHEPDPDLLELEPEDIHLECVL